TPDPGDGRHSQIEDGAVLEQQAHEQLPSQARCAAGADATAVRRAEARVSARGAGVAAGFGTCEPGCWARPVWKSRSLARTVSRSWFRTYSVGSPMNLA